MSFHAESVRTKNIKPCVFKRIVNKSVKMKDMTFLFEWLRHTTLKLSFIDLNLNKCKCFRKKVKKSKKYISKKTGHLPFYNPRKFLRQSRVTH